MTPEGREEPPREEPPREERPEVEFDLDAPPPPATWAGRERAGGGPGKEPEELAVEEELELDEDYEEGDLLAPEPEELDEEQAGQDASEAEEAAGAGGEEPTPEGGATETPEPEPAVEPESSGEPDSPPEADAVPEPTPAPAPDREQSTEAALAGLRARAASKPASTPPPPASVAASRVRRDDEDEKRARAKPMWARFLAASLIIVISMATATSVNALVVLTDLADGFGGIGGLEPGLEEVEGGDPQTILILGSDKRPTDATGRSDTAILLRVDPDEPAMALLSIPRDLKVEIPNHGTQKFNAAYSYGGPPLTLKVVKRVTGLKVHHVVNINFNGFADAVDALGCVYIDADRRYYIAPESGTAEIDIESGYQRMCGLKALQYVRYRHTDTDLVRAARQQDFLREARQKVEPSKLVLDDGYRKQLLDIFKRYTTSDETLKKPIQVLELMKTFVAAQSAPVREVHFPAQVGPIYVEARKDAIAAAVDEFLGTEGTSGPAPTGEAEGPPRREGDGDSKPKPDPEPQPAEPQDQGPAMVDVTGAAQQYAAAFANERTNGGEPMIDFPIRYPTLLTEGSTVDDEGRAFVIDGPGSDKYYGYKFVAQFPGDGGFPEYYGVSGTSWEDPPILANPSETREIDGRDYLLFYDGDRLRLVGWKQKNASYWAINTLTQSLEEAEMLEIATSMAEYDG